jgi:O-antigen/teichoic acid export membrane protein
LTLWFDELFPMPPASRAAAKWTMASLAVAAAITAACKSYQSLLFANRRVHQYQLLSLGLILLRAGFVAGGLWVNWGLKSMGLGTLAATVLFAAATSWVTRSELPLVRFRWALADRATLALITRTGIWFCLNSLAVIALRTLDRMVTAKVLGLAIVTPLALTNRIYELAQTNLAQISNTTWPVLAGQLGRGETSEARSLWRTTTQFSFVMTFVGGACLWAGNGAFISKWVGHANYAGLLVDSLLVANMVALTVIASFRAALTASQKMRPQAMWRISEAIVFVGLAFWLGSTQGLRGIVFAKLVSTLVGSVPWMGAATAGTLGLPTAALLKDTGLMLLRLALCTLPAGLAGRWVSDRLGGYHGAGTGTLATFLLASGPLVIWGIDQPTRNYLSARLGRIPWIGNALKGIIARVSQPSVVPAA